MGHYPRAETIALVGLINSRRAHPRCDDMVGLFPEHCRLSADDTLQRHFILTIVRAPRHPRASSHAHRLPMANELQAASRRPTDCLIHLSQQHSNCRKRLRLAMRDLWDSVVLIKRETCPLPSPRVPCPQTSQTMRQRIRGPVVLQLPSSTG